MTSGDGAASEGVILYPVVARLARDLRGRDGVAEARRLGRVSLDRSSKLAHVEHTNFPRDPERAPTPFRSGGVTWYWSTTNTTGLAGGVVAPTRVAIDAEWLDRPRLEAVLEYFAPAELDDLLQLGLDERRAALALWSAKESVVKLTGVGMAGMGRATLECVLAPGRGTPTRLAVSLEDEVFEVVQVWEGEHVVSLACDAPAYRVQLKTLEGVGA